MNPYEVKEFDPADFSDQELLLALELSKQFKRAFRYGAVTGIITSNLIWFAIWAVNMFSI